MANIKLCISYDGSAYCGWQRQKGQPTVQAAIEDALAVMLGGKVLVNGAGRTDAGVHALAMVANFHTKSELPVSAFRKGLNSLLATDIRIISAERVADDFHARFSAIGKCYAYRFVVSELMPPLLRGHYAHYPGRFSVDLLERAIPSLLGEHDFSAFEAVGSRDRNENSADGKPDSSAGRGAVRCLSNIAIRPEFPGLAPNDYSDAFFCLRVKGNGFLRHMVRNIAATLIDVGRGRREADSIGELLSSKDRSLAAPTAPACGLLLEEVLY